MSSPYLSIIIPAYNEERRLPNTLEQVFSFLAEQEYLAEVIVVENGSHDRTLTIAQEISASFPNLFVFFRQFVGIPTPNLLKSFGVS